MLSGSRRSRRLVGRGAELAELGQVLDALGRGENGAVCVTGEPGIGKTSLIAEVLVRADERHDIGRRVELPPLSVAEAEELLGDQIEPALRDSLYRESG